MRPRVDGGWPCWGVEQVQKESDAERRERLLAPSAPPCRARGAISRVLAVAIRVAIPVVEEPRTGAQGVASRPYRDSRWYRHDRASLGQVRRVDRTAWAVGWRSCEPQVACLGWGGCVAG